MSPCDCEWLLKAGLRLFFKRINKQKYSYSWVIYNNYRQSLFWQMLGNSALSKDMEWPENWRNFTIEHKVVLSCSLSKMSCYRRSSEPALPWTCHWRVFSRCRTSVYHPSRETQNAQNINQDQSVLLWIWISSQVYTCSKVLMLIVRTMCHQELIPILFRGKVYNALRLMTPANHTPLCHL